MKTPNKICYFSLIAFIGRLVGEKAADTLPDAIRNSIYHHHGQANFLILGSGDPLVENKLDELKKGIRPV